MYTAAQHKINDKPGQGPKNIWKLASYKLNKTKKKEIIKKDL